MNVAISDINTWAAVLKSRSLSQKVMFELVDAIVLLNARIEVLESSAKEAENE